MSINLIPNKTHTIIKRDGRQESYNADKMYKVILWACNGSQVFADQLLDAINIKIHNKMSIIKLYDEVIATAANLISDLYPQWEEVAKKLYLLKLHKDLGVKRAVYPSYETIIKMNEKLGYYSTKILNTIDNIDILAVAINPEYDKIFTFGGLNLFVQKYCNHYKDTLLELPQHVYMRVAIQLMYKEGTQAIIDKYHQLASHSVTEATPKMVNSLRPNPAMFSCCLARPEDSLESINGTADFLSRESKYSGGLAADVSAIRAPGAPIEGNKGSSGGVKPFIKGYQELIGSYNQGNTRSMAMCIYYNWFHYQSPEITEMKLESGKDEDRARKLKYAVKWTKDLTNAIKNNEDVYLFDPHKTQDMTFAWGDDLINKLDKYSKNTRIHKRKYNARDLALTLAKTKVETGNNYTFFTDNANIQNIGSADVTQSNLCMEYIPNFNSISHIEDSIRLSNTTNKFYMTRSYTGDIALCNLSSINLMHWVTKSGFEKEQFMYLLVRSMDNAITNSFYSNIIAHNHSVEHRNLGIGVSNYANLLASNKLSWSSKEARKLTHELFEELSYYAIKASIQLAKERSRCDVFEQTKWSEGIFPHELSILHNSDSEFNYPLLKDWGCLRQELLKYGIRNEYILAIAPTATSGLCINATPGVDVPRKLKDIKEGTYSLPFIVPNFKQNKDYYQTLFETNNKDVIELAAIRQKFIDMGQSVSLAYKNPNSAHEILFDIMYAEELGLKTLYYTYTPKPDDLNKEECDSCGS